MLIAKGIRANRRMPFEFSVSSAGDHKYVTGSNFGEDIVPHGRIKQNSDLNEVKTHKNTHLP